MITGRAEALYLSLLRSRGDLSVADVETLCREHPDLAGELRRLRRQSAKAAEVLGRLEQGLDDDPLLAAGFSARYEPLREIAHGGMGRILEVRDRELDRVLAMKVLRTDVESHDHGARRRKRMLAEANVLGRLEHPGIVPIHDVGQDPDGRPFFTMLRVRGRALNEIFEDVRTGAGGWSLTRATSALLKVCEAVAYAHSRGVVHRDLKPANVMVGPFGEVYVMDWGLAKIHGSDDCADLRLQTSQEAASELDGIGATDSILTMDGDVLGTPSYMPPEQGRGLIDRIDERSDVYAVGAMLYHLLSGSPPYMRAGESTHPLEVLQAVLRGDPEPLDGVAREAPVELASICKQAMAREADERYPTMEALAEDLRAFLENRVVRAHATGAFVELSKWMQRHRGIVVSLCVLVVVLFGSAIGLWGLYRNNVEQRGLAERRLAFLRQNPSGERMTFAGTPSLASFVERFGGGDVERPLYVSAAPESVRSEGNAILLPGTGGIGLDDAYAVVRGDFVLELSFELEGLGPAISRSREGSLAVRRARDGRLMASVGVVSRESLGSEPVYLAAAGGNTAAPTSPWPGDDARVRVERRGGECFVDVWDGAWQRLLAVPTTDEPLQFFVFASGGEDAGSFRMIVDELRFTANTPPGGIDVAPQVETFDAGMGDSLITTGDAGVAGVVDGELFIENLDDAVGFSSVGLDLLRYGIRGDFDIRFDYEVLDVGGAPGAGLDFALRLFDRSSIAEVSIDLSGSRDLEARFWIPPRTAAVEGAGARSGKLRARRQGDAVFLEHWNGGWRRVLTAAETGDDIGFEIIVRNTDARASAVVAIDDLHITGLFVRS